MAGICQSSMGGGVGWVGFVWVVGVGVVISMSENLTAYRRQGVKDAWGMRGGSGAATKRYPPRGWNMAARMLRE